MMLRTLIVDDEPLAREALRARLQKDCDIEIVGEAKNGNQAVKEIDRLNPDLVFLDVQMPDMDGFAVVAAVAQSVLPLIVFVTAYEEFAIRAFKVEAIDYLLKPFSAKDFDETIARIKAHWRKRDGYELESRIKSLLSNGSAGGQYLERIVIRERGRVRFVNTADIKCITAERNNLKLLIDKDVFWLRETMNEIEKKLNPKKFLRIHRSTIVNVSEIKEFRPWYTGEYVVLMKDGTELTLSRGYRANFERFLARYQ